MSHQTQLNALMSSKFLKACKLSFINYHPCSLHQAQTTPKQCPFLQEAELRVHNNKVSHTVVIGQLLAEIQDEKQSLWLQMAEIRVFLAQQKTCWSALPIQIGHRNKHNKNNRRLPTPKFLSAKYKWHKTGCKKEDSSKESSGISKQNGGQQNFGCIYYK